MRVVIAPDAFKGSLTALEAAQAMALGIRRAWPAADIRLFPMADGGEGTLDAVLAATGGRRLQAIVTGAHGKPLAADYGLLGEATAVIEVAQVVGFTLPGVSGVPVAERTTWGVGELLRHCLDQGIRRFWVGLGGTVSNDAGVGMLAALGARLSTGSGAAIAPTLSGLAEFGAADFSGLDPRLKSSEIILLSDVGNPLSGEHGATAVFGPQKGVLPAEIARFDECLRRFGAAGDRWLGFALSEKPGTGAAGGLGYALQLLGGRHGSGAEALCGLIGLDAALAGVDWAITGEGRSDAQTLQGKAPWVVAQHAHRVGVPVTLIAGGIDAAATNALARVFDGCFALDGESVDAGRAMREAACLLADCAEVAAKARKK
ncbi:MAG: glycerate kinase [Betaproteobacteria bacterium]